ncbi:MAG: protein-glutamate O-methyltransferase [Pyrinomonadaceae bacterium]
MALRPKLASLNSEQFEIVRNMIYGVCGIRLSENKIQLVQSRLAKRLVALDLPDVEAYLRFLKSDRSGVELVHLVDVLTTNKTNFFRELAHFDFLENAVLPKLSNRRARIWSAACSSGEEPYSVAMLLRDAIPRIDSWDVKILATDISTEILEKARAGKYTRDQLQGVSPERVRKYFKSQTGSNEFLISDEIKKMVGFARLNLMGQFPMKGKFDVILCRNVMIYFDKETQSRLIDRLGDYLTDGGYLMVGHAESLAGGNERFTYVQPAVYRR